MAEWMKEAIFLRYTRSFIFRSVDVGCTRTKDDDVGAISLLVIIDVRHRFFRQRVACG